ncbi:hypothetical protein CK203_101957 [Vitis vinifera]|uniref:Uncharacterized protein n=1 Tax=Vitis vinifera TaxID=29760 RepID=A0A438BYC8_VITVI|nr:hypothetical protein CK203_101957 [Vitis vinifera]
MTTRGIPRPTSIHFTIDGRHVSPRDMVCILSKGTSTDSILLRNELPPGMLLVDVVLCTNLFPLQHSVQRRGAILNALFCISEGFYFGPHHLIMASFIHFEEKIEQAQASSLPTEQSELSLDTTPAQSNVAPTSEPSITISAPKFPALIQQHLGLLPPPQSDIPVSSDSLAPAEVTTPTNNPTLAKDTHSRDPDPTISGGPHRCLSFG